MLTIFLKLGKMQRKEKQKEDIPYPFPAGPLKDVIVDLGNKGEEPGDVYYSGDGGADLADGRGAVPAGSRKEEEADHH